MKARQCYLGIIYFFIRSKAHKSLEACETCHLIISTKDKVTQLARRSSGPLSCLRKVRAELLQCIDHMYKHYYFLSTHKVLLKKINRMEVQYLETKLRTIKVQICLSLRLV